MAMVVRLQSRRVVRAEDLAAHFEISLRTVYRDLAALNEAGIPILGEAGVGYSLMKGYQLPPVMLTCEEANALSLSGKLVEHLTDASLWKQMESALVKIRSVLPRERLDNLDRLERRTAVVSDRQAGLPRLSSETLIPLQRALAECRVVAMEYQGAQRPELTRREVEPLGLAFYSDNWHLIGFCRLRRGVRDFRSDRIRKLQVGSERFSGHADFSLKRYLEASAREGKFEIAQVRFRGDVMKRVRAEWWSRLEAERCEGDSVVATLLVYCVEWFALWLLSFGAGAEVLSPGHIRDQVLAEAQKVTSKYAVSKPVWPMKRPVQESLLT